MDKKVALVADDDASIRTVLNQALMRAGFEVRVTSNVSTLWQWISDGLGHVVISDVIMPDGTAFELLPRIRQHRANLPVILISAQNTLTTAIRAESAGARDYLPKPFDIDELVLAAKRAVSEPMDNRRVQASNGYGQEAPLVGRSQAMQEIYRSIARMMNYSYPVMITGRTGTGKSMIARAFHEAGMRKSKPFSSVRVSSNFDGGAEPEVFEKINTLRNAGGGTLFVRGLSALSFEAQDRLLKIMESQDKSSENLVHFIVSSDTDSENLADASVFRQDLFHRLNVVPIVVPDLRDRKEDIPDLAHHFVRQAETPDNSVKHFEPVAVSQLKSYDWPGNIRELENLIYRVCMLYPQATITEQIISAELASIGAQGKVSGQSSSIGFQTLSEATEHFVSEYYDKQSMIAENSRVYHHFLGEFEKPLIAKTLGLTNGNQIKAAEILGLNRNTLRKKITALDIKITKTAG